MVNALSLLLTSLLAACSSSQYYTAASPVVLVQPKRAWEKPGSTMKDENRARMQCGEELRGNEELRSKGVSDDWSNAARACMARKGFSKTPRGR